MQGFLHQNKSFEHFCIHATSYQTFMYSLYVSFVDTHEMWLHMSATTPARYYEDVGTAAGKINNGPKIFFCVPGIDIIKPFSMVHIEEVDTTR